MRVRRSAVRWVVALPLVVVATLSACAPEPVAGWVPPVREPVPGVSLIAAQAGGAQGVNEQSEDEQSGGELAGEETQGAGSDATAQAPLTIGLPDEKALGLLPGRIRNDESKLAARFVYIPGVPEFNEQVDDEIRRAIDAGGVAYTPTVYGTDAGLDRRGCVAGSTGWAADEVLSRKETGPVGGEGTAITCEITGAFGSVLELRVRFVRGGPDGVDEDRTTVYFADLERGKLVEPVEEWTDAAPSELWRSAVELIRREAGALSTAPLADPDETQLALAASALDRSEQLEGGGLLVTVPAGVASPELEGLRIAATRGPTRVTVEPATVLSWSNEDYLDLHGALDEPFAAPVPASASASTVPIDCSLLPCVALTYDDGPSEHTAKLLDTLRAEQARATFYMLGRKADDNPETISRVVTEGHEIGSHTMNHPDLTTIELPKAVAEVRDAVNELERVSGRSITTFRPPYGAINDEIIEAVGMPAVLWSVDTNDWQEPGEPVVVERTVSGAKPGGIVLFHDTHGDTVAAADDVIRGLRARGFETVTVTQLFDGNVPSGRVSGR